MTGPASLFRGIVAFNLVVLEAPANKLEVGQLGCLFKLSHAILDVLRVMIRSYD